MPPTLADLTRQPGASLTFDCRPCGRHTFYYGEKLARFMARVPAGETLDSLKARMVCPQCKMPIDGVFRTFTFSRGSGDERHGWSGPEV